MQRKTITRSDTLPISIDEFARWSRIDVSTDDNEFLQGLIRAGRDAAENFTGRTLTAMEVEFTFTGTERLFSLPTLPVRSIEKVELENADGDRTELAKLTDYRERVTDFVANVRLLRALGSDCLVVTALTGHLSATSIPQPIKQAIAIHAANAYRGREGQDEGNETFERLPRPHCLGSL